MVVKKQYKIYYLSKIMNSDQLALTPLEVNWMDNDFINEESAIQYLIDNKKQYEGFIILPNIRIYEQD